MDLQELVQSKSWTKHDEIVNLVSEVYMIFRIYVLFVVLCSSAAFAQSSPTSGDSQLENISIIQQMLNDLGYDAGDASGANPDATINAIRQFQEDNGLAISGKFTSNSLATLIEFHQVSFGKTEINNFASIEAPEIQSLTTDEKQKQSYEWHHYLQNNPNEFRKFVVPYLIDQKLIKAISNDDVVINLLENSIPFVGCRNEHFQIYGYYNVVQNVWVITWIKDEKIVRLASTDGFAFKNKPESNAWFDIYQENVSKKPTISDAIKAAFEIQRILFFEIFGGSNCPEYGDVRNFFNYQNSVVAPIINQYEMSRIYSELLEDINFKVRSGFKIDKPEKLILAGVNQNVVGFDYLTIHVFRNNATKLVVGGWEINSGSPVIAHEEFIDLLTKEIED